MRKTIVLYNLIIIFQYLSINSIFALELTPISLARQIFSKNNTADLSNHFSGSYKGHPNGKDLNDYQASEFLILTQNATSSVIGVTLIKNDNSGVDLYLYFNKSNVWKLYAIRSLAMTQTIKGALAFLTSLTDKQIEDEIRKNQRSQKGSFASKEELTFLMGSMKLTLDLDKNIINHFLKNRPDFDELLKLAKAQKKSANGKNERSLRLLKNHRASYLKLNISQVFYGDGELGGNGFSFVIGGITDNTVGFLYVDDIKDLPAIKPNRVIMLKKMAKGWYLYKTT